MQPGCGANVHAHPNHRSSAHGHLYSSAVSHVGSHSDASRDGTANSYCLADPFAHGGAYPNGDT